METSSAGGTKTVEAESVPALERALDVLELLGQSDAPLTLSEIVSRLALPKGSVHRLLAALKARGYVAQENGGRGPFRLGGRLLSLASGAGARTDVVGAAPEIMRRLAAETGEGCQLSLRVEGRALCVLRVPSPLHPEISLGGGVGTALPLHAVAVGKVLLSFAPEDEQAAYTEGEPARFTPNTIIGPLRLRREMAAIRTNGFAHDREEYKRGLCAVAAPVRSGAGTVCAALALPYLAGAADEEAFTAATVRAANEISAALGWTGESLKEGKRNKTK